MSSITASSSGIDVAADNTGDLDLVASGSLSISGTGVTIDFGALIRSAYQGLTMAYVSTTSFSVAIGTIGDSTFVSTMILAAATTKTTSTWAVGSAQGGLDTGAIAASTWYAVYLIKRVDTNVVDVIYSTNSTSPALPVGYTLFRRIGWVRTNGSSQFVQWFQRGRQFIWNTKVVDINAVTPANTTRNLVTVTLPPSVEGIFTVYGTASITVTNLQIGWTSISDVASTSANRDLFIGGTGTAAIGITYIRINIDGSSQIFYRSDVTTGTAITLLTQGWTDNL